MTLVELDLLVKYLYENRQIAILDDIHAGFNKVCSMPPFDVLIMINKLEKDELVTRRKTLIRKREGEKLISRKVMPAFNISFEGIDFYEAAKGKYVGKPYQYQKHQESLKKRATAIENIPKRFWYIFALITFIIGLFADIGKETLRNKLLPTPIKYEQHTLILKDTSLTK